MFQKITIPPHSAVLLYELPSPPPTPSESLWKFQSWNKHWLVWLLRLLLLGFPVTLLGVGTDIFWNQEFEPSYHEPPAVCIEDLIKIF